MSQLLMNSGRVMDINLPRQDDLLIEDIAHHLSRITRFNGATDYPYTVAEHSIYVSYLVGSTWALEGLMHDATEAYLGDVTSPLKGLLPEYRKLEKQWWLAIAARFGLPETIPFEVHVADMEAYVKERIELMPEHAFSEDPDYHNFVGVIVPERDLPEFDGDPDAIAVAFLERFYELTSRETIEL